MAMLERSSAAAQALLAIEMSRWHSLLRGRGRVRSVPLLIIAVICWLVYTGRERPDVLVNQAEFLMGVGIVGSTWVEASVMQRGWTAWWLALPWPRRLLVRTRWQHLCRIGALWAAVVGCAAAVVTCAEAWVHPDVWFTSETARLGLDVMVFAACLISSMAAVATALSVSGGALRIIMAVLAAWCFLATMLSTVHTFWVAEQALGWAVRLWLAETGLSAVCSVAAWAIAESVLRSGPLALVGDGRLGGSTSRSRSSRRMPSESWSNLSVSAATSLEPRRALFHMFFRRWRLVGPGAHRSLRTVAAGFVAGIFLVSLGLGIGADAESAAAAWGFMCELAIELAALMGLILTGPMVAIPVAEMSPVLAGVPVRHRWLVAAPVVGVWLRIVMWVGSGAVLGFIGLALGADVRGDAMACLSQCGPIIGELLLRGASLAVFAPLAACAFAGASLSCERRTHPLFILALLTVPMLTPGVFDKWAMTHIGPWTAIRWYLIREVMVLAGLGALCAAVLHRCDHAFATSAWRLVLRAEQRRE